MLLDDSGPSFQYVQLYATPDFENIASLEIAPQLFSSSQLQSENQKSISFVVRYIEAIRIYIFSIWLLSS